MVACAFRADLQKKELRHAHSTGTAVPNRTDLNAINPLETLHRSPLGEDGV